MDYQKQPMTRRYGMDKPFEEKPGKGKLFTNKNKEANGDKHDWFGSIRIPFDVEAGETISINAYKNESQSGTKYIGIQVKDRKEPDLK